MLPPGSVVIGDIVGYRYGFTAPTVPGQLGGGPFGIVGYSESDATTPANPAVGQPAIVEKQTYLYVAPSLDLVVGEHLTVGGSIMVLSIHQEIGGAAGVGGFDQMIFGVSPRVGYLARLSDDLAIWPRASLGASYGQAASSPGHLFAWSAAVDVPFVAGLGRHVVFMVGPALGYSGTSEQAGTPVGGLASASAFHVGVYGSIGLVL
jgi:hypothetical protein